MVFNRLRFALNLSDYGTKAVNNVITFLSVFLLSLVAYENLHHCVAYPVAAERDILPQPTNALADVGGVRVFSKRKRQRTLAENDDVDVHWLEKIITRFVHVKCTEADKIVILKQLDLLACFLCHDVFSCQRMNRKGTGNCTELLLVRV